jgi:hypothetical protein
MDLHWITRCLIFEIEQGRRPWTCASDSMLPHSVSTFSRSFRVRSQRKLQQILDPIVGLGAGCSKSTYGYGAMEGPFFVKSLWSKLWNCAKRGCRIQQESRARGAETLRSKSGRAWAKSASAPQWMTLAECYIVYDIEPDMLWYDLRYRTSQSDRPSISYTISTYDIELCLFDIECIKPRYHLPC